MSSFTLWSIKLWCLLGRIQSCDTRSTKHRQGRSSFPVLIAKLFLFPYSFICLIFLVHFQVRGYTFNVNSGAIESLELDSFGISIIPSSLVCGLENFFLFNAVRAKMLFTILFIYWTCVLVYLAYCMLYWQFSSITSNMQYFPWFR